MKVHTIIILVSLAFLVSCNTLFHDDWYDVKQDHDPFTGKSTVYMFDNKGWQQIGNHGYEVSLNFRRTITEASDTSFSIELVYHADSWLFIDDEKPLTLLLDGTQLLLYPSSEPSREARYYGVTETVMFHTDKGTLKRIASAKSVIGRVHGDHFYQDFNLADWNFRRMRDYLQTYAN